ncbi:active regulator of SIRT1 [Narcine bancroftii]|uniref:active regulator of SIRT1 n=1 Tax=Narcine bancroftii TaxID=1343680 RepID=UPI0038312F73
MSAALVRKALDLLREDVRGKSKKTSQRYQSGGADCLANTSKRGRRKALEKIRRQQEKNKATVKGKIVKSALEEYRKNSAAVDHTEENLWYLLGCKYRLNNQVTEKVVEYSRGRKAKDRPKVKKVKKEEKSAFSERDFKKFAREYFGQT